MKLPRIVAVKPVGGYRLELTFSDGVQGEVDLERDVVGRGGMFKAMEDPQFFARVEVERDAGTIVWPNEVDLCPDVLHGRLTGARKSPGTPAVTAT